MMALPCGPGLGFGIGTFRMVLRVVVALSQQLDEGFYLALFTCASFVVPGPYDITLPSHQTREYSDFFVSNLALLLYRLL